MLEVIYIVRHGYRSNWVVDPTTGTYHSNLPSPTGIPSDPALASYGVDQAEQLGKKMVTLDPPVDVMYSSPFYRCLQTLAPTVRNLRELGKTDGAVRTETGLGEFYGLARFDHPQPAPPTRLRDFFDFIADYESCIVPSEKGESITGLHDRFAYALHRVIERLDQDPSGPRALLVCTHAAGMIAMGRVLTGSMPEDVGEEDFRCFTCALSTFKRRGAGENERVEEWSREDPNVVPKVGWRGKGVQGGWDCLLNGDCSFLKGGEERGWSFSGDEAFVDEVDESDEQAKAEEDSEAKGSRL